MKINKKECVKHSNLKAQIDRKNGVLYYTGISHFTRAAIKIIAGRRMLIVYFYNRKRILEGCSSPEYTLFQYKDDYITLETDRNGNKKWRESCLEKLLELRENITAKSAFYRHKDEQLITRFCNISGKKGFGALHVLQASIMHTRITKRHLERDRKITARMKPIPAAPRGLMGWVNREILPYYIFYEYSRKKPMNGYCTACKKDVIVDNAKHNSSGKCPKCRKIITYKAKGKAKYIYDRDTVQVLQKINEDELILRIYKVYQNLRNYREPEIRLYECARIFVRHHADKMYVERYYHSYGKGLITDWVKGIRPSFSYYQYNFECDCRGHVYCENLDKVLKDTPWQYCQLGQYYKIKDDKIEVIPYLSGYIKYPVIEYLVKLGFINLVTAIAYNNGGERVIDREGNSLSESLSVDTVDIPVLKKINVTVNQLELFQKLKKAGITASENLLIWYKKNDILLAENVLIPLKYTTQIKLMRYVEEQLEYHKDLKTRNNGQRYSGINSVLSDYKDYLIMAENLNYDLSNSFVLFPKNISEAHDNAIIMFDAKKNKMYNKKIRSLYKNLSDKYEFTKNGFTLIPPKTAQEIIAEGHSLHHCVNSYVESIAEGVSVILFVRQTDKVDEPFYTVEIRDDKVIQIQGKFHCAPTEEVKKFVDMWKREKLKAA